MKLNPYMPIPATIDHIVEETPTIKTFGLRPEEPIAFQAGQFVELTVPGSAKLPLRLLLPPQLPKRWRSPSCGSARLPTRCTNGRGGQAGHSRPLRSGLPIEAISRPGNPDRGRWMRSGSVAGPCCLRCLKTLITFRTSLCVLARARRTTLFSKMPLPRGGTKGKSGRDGFRRPCGSRMDRAGRRRHERSSTKRT